LLLACWSGARAQVHHSGLVWQDFKSDVGGFSAKFPGTPVIGQTAFTKGPLTVTRYTHSVNLSPGLSFEIDYMDTSAEDADFSLEGGISGMIRSLTAGGATVLTRETVVRGSCEGRDATLLLNKPGAGKSGFSQGRIFNSGSRFFFMVFVATVDSAETREIARTFVESFNIPGGCNSLTAPVEAPPATKPTVETVEGSADEATGWRSIDSKDLGFRVLMPGPIRHQTDQAQLKPFPLTHHTYINSGDRNVYSAEVFSEYPPGFHDSEASYQTAIDVTLYALQKNLASDGFVLAPLRDLKVGRFPGREFQLTSEKADLHGRVQIYATPKRLYIFIAFARDQGVAVKLLNRFFQSIMISAR
jgi:hypothetical protein